jgi:hemerythrin-like domain-containing protein
MSTANFNRYDADYVYVPKSYRDIDYNDEDIGFWNSINDNVLEELEKFQNDLDKKLKTIKSKRYAVYITGVKGWADKDSQIVFVVVIEGYDENDEYMNSLTIEVLRSAGYYQAENIAYRFDDDVDSFIEDDKEARKVFEKTIELLEDTLTKHFDKYGIAYQASNGETGYHKIN